MDTPMKNMTTLSKKCKNCGSELLTKSKKRKFCSRSCSVSWSNKNSDLHKKSVGESLRNSEKLAGTMRRKGLERRESQRDLMERLWNDKRDFLKSQISKSITAEVVLRRSASLSKNWARKLKISASLFKFHSINPLFWIQKGRVLRANTFKKFLDQENIVYKKKFRLQGNEFDYFLVEKNTLVMICDSELFGYDTNKNLTKEQLESLGVLIEKEDIAKSSGYEFVILTQKEILSMQKVDDMYSLNRKLVQQELLEENKEEGALLYGALPLLDI